MLLSPLEAAKGEGYRKVVEGRSSGSLPGAAAIMPILTGTSGGKYASRIIDQSWLSREYETEPCRDNVAGATREKRGCQNREYRPIENSRVTTALTLCSPFRNSIPALIQFWSSMRS